MNDFRKYIGNSVVVDIDSVMVIVENNIVCFEVVMVWISVLF